MSRVVGVWLWVKFVRCVITDEYVGEYNFGSGLARKYDLTVGLVGICRCCKWSGRFLKVGESNFGGGTVSECTHPRWRHQIPPPAKQQSAAELFFVRNFEVYGAMWLVSSLWFDGKVVPKVELLVLHIIHPIQLVLSSPVVGATGRLLNLLLKVTTP